MTSLPRLLSVVLLLSAAGSRLSAQDGQVVFERTGYRLTSLGGRVSVAARVLDGRRRAVPNAPIAWRIEDPAVAIVNARGEVQSRRVGRTRLWAVSGSDSASALILVDQWAARFAFQPAILNFTSMGETRPVQMQARDASGNAIPGIRLASACRILNPRIATLGGGGQVTANATGTTWLRCTDRGVADSLRIDVRPRAASAIIVDKAIYSTPRTVSDSFQIRMRAVDSRGQAIPDARPTWASMEPRVLSIDPLSGWARAVGVGSSRVVAQLGDITDTVDVSVIAGAGMNLAPIVPTGEVADTVATAPGRATLAIYSQPTSVGDTTPVQIVARDPKNALVDVSRVSLRLSGDSGIARLTRDRRLIGRKEGVVWIVGSFADITDSSQVTITAEGSTGDATEAEAEFVRPRYDTVAARVRNSRLVDSTMRQILASSAIRASTGRMVAGQFVVVQAAHAARLSDDYFERRTGLLFGGRVVVTPFRRIRLTGNIRNGTLTPDESTPGEDMNFTEADGQLGIVPTRWMSLEAGYTLRGQGTGVAAQKWSFGTVSMLLHPRLIGDNFRTVVGVTMMPLGTLKDTPTSELKLDASSIAGDAGVEWSAGFLNAGILFHSERLTFSYENGNQRVDRFSMLRLRVGLQLGH